MNLRKRINAFLPCLSGWAFLITTEDFAWAQDATRRVVGIVSDQTGAVVAGVRIVVTNTATKVSRETVADSSRYYQVLALPVGDYTVSAEHKGFTSVTTRPDHLEINESVKIDLRLEVGKATETVVVESSAHAIETINAMPSSTVSDRVVEDMPLNGRNTLNLVLLQPGVPPGGDNPGNLSGGGATDSNGLFLSLSIGGGR